jgi:hypothetical protein
MSVDDDEAGDDYDVMPRLLCEGDVVMEDPMELFERTGSIAAMVRDGVLFLLRRDSLKWVNVEDALKTERGNVVQAVKTRQ